MTGVLLERDAPGLHAHRGKTTGGRGKEAAFCKLRGGTSGEKQTGARLDLGRLDSRSVGK